MEHKHRDEWATMVRERERAEREEERKFQRQLFDSLGSRGAPDSELAPLIKALLERFVSQEGAVAVPAEVEAERVPDDDDDDPPMRRRGRPPKNADTEADR